MSSKCLYYYLVGLGRSPQDSLSPTLIGLKIPPCRRVNDQSGIQRDTQVLRSQYLRIVDVGRGCTAIVEGSTFLSALRPDVEVQHLATLFPDDFLAGANFTIGEV